MGEIVRTWKLIDCQDSRELVEDMKAGNCPGLSASGGKVGPCTVVRCDADPPEGGYIRVVVTLREGP